jgi:hypothetical protein
MFTRQWVEDTLVRVARTFAQSLAGVFVVGTAINAVDWKVALSMAGGTALASLLNAIAAPAPGVVANPPAQDMTPAVD